MFNLSNDFIYGSIGGFCGVIISHPFDTIKTRIQSNTATTILQAIKMKQLYSGITPPLFGIMLEKSIVFGFYNESKKIGLNNFWSGIIGGFMSTLIVTPVDRLKIHYQNNKFLEKIRFNNLYKGFIPTIFRETPGFGIYFSTYNYLTTKYNPEKNSILKTFIAGSLSGFVSWIFIYPSDLIKTIYQSNNKSNMGLFDVIKYIANNNNERFLIAKCIKNFYRGFPLAIMRAMPLHGGVFMGYEFAKKFSF
jgi:hypothetical protein